MISKVSHYEADDCYSELEEVLGAMALSDAFMTVCVDCLQGEYSSICQQFPLPAKLAKLQPRQLLSLSITIGQQRMPPIEEFCYLLKDAVWSSPSILR